MKNPQSLAEELYKHFPNPDLEIIKKIKEKTIVKFTNGKYSHWVVAENGKVVFNSLKYSKCVSEGKPTEARIIKIKGAK